MTCQLRRKIKFENEPTKWEHHRGGWSYAFETLEKLYAPDGILCVSAIEEWIVNDTAIEEPWIGFVHQVPENNYFYYPDLHRLVNNAHFLKSLDNCRGLFVLSSVVKEYLLAHLRQAVPVVCVLYPMTPFPDSKAFCWEQFHQLEKKRVLFIGEFLRNYQSFYDLKIPNGYMKYLLKAPDVNFEKLLDCQKQRINLKTNASVTLHNERVSDEYYDELLSSSIVFLSLYDAPANTTVIECLGRNTPLVVNRLPGVEEYLGKDYPLFYDTLEDAAALLKDSERLLQASEYMKLHPIKQLLTRESFLESFISSSIYRCLPLPSSQQTDPDQIKFPQFDLTVVICSYKRVYNLQHLLQCFKKQDFRGSFEIILWNNNFETQNEVTSIAAPYMQDLNMRLIQSSENYYCIIRLAVPKLMRSEILLICDDDVVPNTSYISTFISKYKTYGPRVVLCCRGHVFAQHYLNEEEPHKFWDEYESMKFCDENHEDREVIKLCHLYFQ